jgi:hypothetical protein
MSVSRHCGFRKRDHKIKEAWVTFADKKGELSRQSGMLPQDAYTKLLKLVDNAHAKCEIARLALERFRDGISKAAPPQTKPAAVSASGVPWRENIRR